MFRRRRHAADDGVETELEAEPVEIEAPQPGQPTLRQRADGPWDSEEEGRPGDDRPQLDLGALRIPGAPGMEIRVDIDQASQRPVAVNLVMGQGALQLQAFAAPRTLGLWDEIREELQTGLAANKGSPREVDGPLGPELYATVTANAPDGKTVSQPVRFIGVDGPRWFLRGVLSGRALTDPGLANRLIEVFRGVVVVRGGDAMPPRELLPLRLPTQGQPVVGEQPPESTTAAVDDLNPFERGPEITERR
ncbi:MAG: DUF3710 domain-containing protein [Candidatus Nanopelagicales bacterium]